MKKIRWKEQARFQKGDEVRLSEPFTYIDDDKANNRDYDKEIRTKYTNYGVVLDPISEQIDGEYVCYVLWGDKETVQKVIASERHTSDRRSFIYLYTDESCLELILPPVTDEEVEQAIESIKQAAKE